MSIQQEKGKFGSHGWEPMDSLILPSDHFFHYLLCYSELFNGLIALQNYLVNKRGAGVSS